MLYYLIGAKNSIPSGAVWSATKQLLLAMALGSRSLSLFIVNVEGGMVRRMWWQLLTHSPSSVSRSIKLARARLGDATIHLPPPSTIIEHRKRAVARSTCGAKTDKQQIQGRKNRFVARTSQPRQYHALSPSNKIRRVPLQTSPCPPSKLAIIWQWSEHNLSRPLQRSSTRQKFARLNYNLVQHAHINLTSSHNRRHPAEATTPSKEFLCSQQQNQSPKRKKNAARYWAREDDWRVVTPRSMSRKTEMNLRVSPWWAFKTPDIGNTEQEYERKEKRERDIELEPRVIKTGNYWRITQENSNISYYLLVAQSSSETPRLESVLDPLLVKVQLMWSVASTGIHAEQYLEIVRDYILLWAEGKGTHT